ncbi:MAG: peptidyl-prolyl cis-trans isomerase [Zoogloeaceae bacterium]|jgi:peptidyl-prolyl cis-trans isomerase A (cyclophilin A)|nr:peptidyl-prolyl cis-trans isomerase [Zoogloeaceae bacterium]
MRFWLFLLAFLSLPALAKTEVVLHTNQGDITLELDERRAPQTVQNFIDYAKDGFYDGTIFHRVIPGFMIQGGGFTPDMTQKATRAPIKNESKNRLKNRRGTIAMARTADPDSATAQFFINLVDNGNLDYPSFDGAGYCVFGKVIEGMEIVDKIAQVSTGRVGPHENVPKNPVVIQSVTITEKDKK